MGSEIRDCNFERDTGFGNLTKRDSGNVILIREIRGRKCTNKIKLSSSGMSEIGQQNVSTTQSRGYCDPYGDLLSVL